MNNDKQLIPEEDNDCPQCRGCGGGELVNGYMTCPFCKGTGTNEWVSKQDNGNPTPDEIKSTQTNDALSFFKIMCPTLYGDVSLNHARMIVETMRRYANSKTAPKDEEMAKHQGSLKEIGLLVLQLQQDNKAKDERIKFLVHWADTNDHLIQNYKESEMAKDERIKELESLYNLAIQTSVILRDQRNKALDKVIALDTRIPELEKRNAELNEAYGVISKYVRDANNDRVKAQETSAQWRIIAAEKTKGKNQYRKERDQAFDLLERWKNYQRAESYTGNANGTKLLCDRDALLSSRENKKP